MRELKMIMKLDGRTFCVGLGIPKDATLKEYDEVLDAINRAMSRVIKKEYFNFSKEGLLLDCLRKEP